MQINRTLRTKLPRGEYYVIETIKSNVQKAKCEF